MKNTHRQKQIHPRQEHSKYKTRKTNFRLFDITGSINPGNNFYKYVNNSWQESIHVPPYISSYGISEEVEHKIDTTLQKIINNSIKISKLSSNQSKSSILEKYQQSVGTFAQSALKSSIQKNSVQTLSDLLQSLNCIRDKNDIMRILGEISLYKIRGLIWCYGQYHAENKHEYTFTLGVGGLGLPDISYYNKTAPGKSRTLFHYAKLLDKVGKIFNIDNLSSVIPMESTLANDVVKSLRDSDMIINGKELEDKFPDIPWDIYFSTLGLPKWKTQKFCIDSAHWIKTIESLFKQFSIQHWILYLKKEFILNFISILPPPFDDIHFELYRKRLRGQASKTPQYILTLELIKNWMTQFISRIYVDIIMSKLSLKKEATKFVREIVDSAEIRLGDVEWLQPTTRDKAQEKVKHMLCSVGYPDSFYSNLKIPTLTIDNLLKNLLVLGEWRTQYEIERLGENRNKQKDWDDPVFEVNAYYYSQGNEIVIPSGSLYNPFFNNNNKLSGWNYGGLGAVLGHEMTHAFDIEGKEYDENGDYNKWWSSQDNRSYNKRTRAIVALFNRQSVLGHSVSGELTLSENISDLGGVAIALDALHRRIAKDKIVDEIEKKDLLRQFFISYAVSWRVKEKPAKVLQSLFLDRHAPPHLRVNLVVSQFQEWYDVFDIKPLDTLFIAEENRIKIF